MEFKELTHSDNIWEDIQNVFGENIHSLIFFNKEVFDILDNMSFKMTPYQLSEYEYDISINIPGTVFVKDISDKDFSNYPNIIGFFQVSKNMYMITYYRTSSDVISYPYENYVTNDNIEKLIIIE